ncbi:hypothetical protein RSAG8_03756, partial [Rhizoctonia solani AG-8 WAC10335]
MNRSMAEPQSRQSHRIAQLTLRPILRDDSAAIYGYWVGQNSAVEFFAPSEQSLVNDSVLRTF